MKFFKMAERELNTVRNLLSNTQVPIGPIGSLERTDGRSGINYTIRFRRGNKPSSLDTRKKLTSEEAAKIKKERFTIELVKRLKANEKTLCKLLKNYQPYNPESIWASLPQAYKPDANDTAFLDNNCDSVQFEPGYSSLHPSFRITSYQNTHPISSPQYTLKGRAVRSKSEALIGSALESAGINYLYDRIVELENGNGDIAYLSPDFIILCPNGEVVIWEHFGLLSNNDYSEKAGRKFYLYSLNGFTMNKNLIFTSDSAEGSIFVSSIMTSIDLVIKPNF